MKKKLFLITTLATLFLSGSSLVFGKEFNLYQTNSGVSKKQTETAKKEAKEKRMEAKKEAEKQRREARLAAKNSSKTTKKKHKKFLGIF